MRECSERIRVLKTCSYKARTKSKCAKEGEESVRLFREDSSLVACDSSGKEKPF